MSSKDSLETVKLVLRFKITKGGVGGNLYASISHRIHVKRASPGFPLRGSLEDWTVPGRVRSDMRTPPAVEGLKGVRDYLKSTQMDSKETDIVLGRETLEE